MKLGVCSTLFLVLLVLKLCEVTAISWWWVFAPLILVFAWWFVAVPLIFFGVLAYGLMMEYKNGRL